jgi:hypothetical protein
MPDIGLVDFSDVVLSVENLEHSLSCSKLQFRVPRVLCCVISAPIKPFLETEMEKKRFSLG